MSQTNVEHYIDKARCEPIHLKNNVSKELFMKCMNLVLIEAKIPSSIKYFKEIQPENLFFKFIKFVKHDMNCNYLSKKLVTWLPEKRKKFCFSIQRERKL